MFMMFHNFFFKTSVLKTDVLMLQKSYTLCITGQKRSITFKRYQKSIAKPILF